VTVLVRVKIKSTSSCTRAHPTSNALLSDIRRRDSLLRTILSRENDGEGKDKGKMENDVIGLLDEGGLQQDEEESRTM